MAKQGWCGVAASHASPLGTERLGNGLYSWQPRSLEESDVVGGVEAVVGAVILGFVLLALLGQISLVVRMQLLEQVGSPLSR